MPDGTFAYVSVLVRLWRVKVRGEWSWRGTLEDVLTGERQGFYGLSGLDQMLEMRMTMAVEDKQRPEAA